MNIVVLCGGLSMERNVSITSSTLICKALRRLGHRAVLVDMFFGLEDCPGDWADLFDNLPPVEEACVSEEAPDLEAVRAQRRWKSPSLVGKGVFELCSRADLVFLGLHGACGEDGRIQAALDLMGIPYTGSGCLGSAIAMDKDLTKKLVRSAGATTPQWQVIDYTEGQIEAISAEAKLPCVVKPVDSGSSIGVAIAHTRQELAAALRENLALGRVILEEYIRGREIQVAVLNGKALPSIEIIPKSGFYDYRNKYQAGAALEICPAPVDAETEKRIGATALMIHKLLKLRTYSRTDFILREDGELYFLEINTLPGMTPTSLVPQEAAAVGIDYDRLCGIIVDSAVGGAFA